MKKVILLAFFAIAAPFVASAQVNVEQLPKMSINMSCDTLVAPDRFQLSIVIADNKGAGKAGIENAEKKVLIPTLKSLGVDVKKDLVVSGYFSGYDKKTAVANKSYSLTVRSVTTLNEILTKITDADISISVVEATVSNQNEIADLMRIKALKESKREAETMMSAIGCKVGRLLTLSLNANVSGDVNDGEVANGMMMARSKALNSSREGVDSYQKRRISTYITVNFEIVNK